MARMGQFTGATEQYGAPVSFVHPKDNDFEKARFTDTVLDPRWKMTDKQRREAQKQIDELYFFLGLGQEKVGG